MFHMGTHGGLGALGVTQYNNDYQHPRDNIR